MSLRQDFVKVDVSELTEKNAALLLSLCSLAQRVHEAILSVVHRYRELLPIVTRLHRGRTIRDEQVLGAIVVKDPSEETGESDVTEAAIDRSAPFPEPPINPEVEDTGSR